MDQKNLLQIKKPKNSAREGVSHKYPEILEHSFISYIVGKPGSGKTYLLQQLIEDDQIYGGKFDKILILSPSKIEVRNAIILSKFDLNSIYEFMFQHKEKMNLLIVIDDFIAQIKKAEFDPQLTQLIFNRRNLIKGTVSIMITSQKYVLLPASIRSSITSLYIFNAFGNDISRINSELIQKKYQRLFVETFQHKDIHDFIYIRVNPFHIYLNFQELTIPEEYYQKLINQKRSIHQVPKDDSRFKSHYDEDQQVTKKVYQNPHPENQIKEKKPLSSYF